MFVLWFRPLLGTPPPTHLIDHVLDSTREPGQAVNGSHIRHLFFLGGRDRPGTLTGPAPFSLPGLRLCSQSRRQCPTHRHALDRNLAEARERRNEQRDAARLQTVA